MKKACSASFQTVVQALPGYGAQATYLVSTRCYFETCTSEAIANLTKGGRI